MSEDLPELLHQQTAALNFPFTPDLLDRVVASCPGRTFQELLDARTAVSALPDVWNASYNRLDPERAIPVCLAVRNVLRPGPEVVGTRFGRLRWDATFFHVHLYLAGALQAYATERMARGRSRLVRPMLEEAIRCWETVEADADRLLAPESKARRIWRGKRGVTRLYLARNTRQPFDLLRKARADLEYAEAEGDTSPGHFTFLLEVLTRLSDDPKELPELWDAADALIERAALHVVGSSRWLVNLGEHRLKRAQAPHCRSADGPDVQSASALYGQLREDLMLSGGENREAKVALGRAALYYAKVVKLAGGSDDEGVMLLHEARDMLTSCLGADPADTGGEEEVQEVSSARVTCLLAEVCLRLFSFTRAPDHLTEAIDRFESLSEDDQAPDNLHGLLGEAYLWRARTGSDADLRTALEYKARARDLGDPNPGNFSVSAAGHHQLWRSTGAPEEHAAAVDLAVKAWKLDPHWPWPLMQLAEFTAARARTAAPADATEGTPNLGEEEHADPKVSEILRAVGEGDQAWLYREAAWTAVHAQPFRQEILGGRSDTFVLDDPQRLLSSTLVLKPTSRGKAEAERDHLASLRRYLKDTRAPDWMLLPVPLATVELPRDWPSLRKPAPDTALASRRAVGRSLAAAIADAYEGRGGHPQASVSRAVRYLARIHAWAANESRAPGQDAATATGAYARAAGQLAKRAGRLGVSRPDALGARWRAVTPASLPPIPGRDAHAENWLVTGNGKVVALDLEPHGHFPLLYEVVQLLEDHAALDLKESDWREREVLCHLYLDELAALGHPVTVTDVDVLPAYQSFALVRAVFLREHLSESAAADSSASTGSRRWAQRRLAHAHALMQRCEETAAAAGLRSLAVELRGFLDG
ncbi:aminoglycoside phosphotransferase family protein [Streptomyces sp. YKOK-I1]